MEINILFTKLIDTKRIKCPLNKPCILDIYLLSSFGGI